MPNESTSSSSGSSSSSSTSRTSTVTPERMLKSPKLLMSHLARIKDAAGEKGMAAFAAFPKDVEFDGQDRGEHIVLLLRQHPAVYIKKVFAVILMVLLPILLLPLLGALEVDLTASDVFFAMGLVILWIMLVLSYVLVTFLNWFFNVNIVTTERIIDIDFTKIFYHKVSEAQLEKVEDISHATIGMWAAMFDYGNVYIQTAAEQREFEFSNIPRPRDVQDTINDLLELKQRG